MGFKIRCNRFCRWYGYCVNQSGGECLGFEEPDEDETEDFIDKITY